MFRLSNKARKLDLPDELVAAINDLKKRVCDFRDQCIAHENSPRTLQGTAWSEEAGTAHIVGTRLYPRETDPKQSETEELRRLGASLDSYLNQVAGFLCANDAKTNLQPEPELESPPQDGP